MFLRSLPLRLYHSGNSFMVPVRHKSLPNENGGWRAVAGAGSWHGPGAVTCLCPQQLLPWCSLLLLVVFAGSTPTCCCHKGVNDHHGWIQVGACGQPWRRGLPNTHTWSHPWHYWVLRSCSWWQAGAKIPRREQRKCSVKRTSCNWGAIFPLQLTWSNRDLP